MRILDRYLIRQILPLFLLALAVFTFILAVNPMLDHAKQLLAKGVPLQTVGFLLLTLLPQSLGVTIPMAFLAALLMAMSRLSADREAVALLACGVSPARILAPVLGLATLVGAMDLYVMVFAVPDANQAFREATYKLLAKQTEADVKPGLFYEGFPGRVVYVQGTKPEGGWSAVFLADTTQAGRPTVTLAEEGQVVLDEAKRQVHFLLFRARTYAPGIDPAVYNVSRSEGDDPLRITITADEVFGTGVLERGLPEKSIPDLKALIAEQRQNNISPHVAILYLHQKFSFPVACLVFALCGVAVGLHTRKEGKLGGMMLGLVIVFVYYAFMQLAEAATKGHLLNAAWARWVPNIVVGALGVVALWWRSRAAGADVSIPMPAWLDRALSGTPATSAAGSPGVPGVPGPRKAVVVIRIPRLALPRPRLLDMYVGSRYLRLLSLAFVSLIFLYYIGTIIDLSEKVIKGQASTTMLLQYLWYSTPQYIVYLMPMATLIAVLGTIGGMTRSSEMTVMRACGVSLYRAAVPLVIFSLLSSGVLFLIQERILAPANREARVLNETIRTGKAPHTLNVDSRNWLAEEGRIYYYLLFAGAPASPTLVSLSVFETALKPYRLVAHTYTARAVHGGGQWLGDAGWVRRFGADDRPTREEFRQMSMAIAAPAKFGAASVQADLMTFGQLRAYISRLGDSGFSVAEERVRLQSKIAFPLVTLVMTILGIPFGVTTGRHGALYGVGLAIGLGAVHFLLAYFFIAVGSAAVMPAALAAWATNILFLAAAGYLLLTVRT